MLCATPCWHADFSLKLTNCLLGIPLYVISYFSLSPFKISPLYLIFVILIIVFLSVDARFILLETLCASQA